MELMELTSPVRPVLFELHPLFYPFGDSPARDALDGLDNVGELLADDADACLKVLFLGCRDLRNPLVTLCHDDAGLAQNLLRQIHIQHDSTGGPLMARHVLILKIITGPDFNPENEADMNYLWDVWYNATWRQSTLVRFLRDVESLLNKPLPDSIVIPKSSYQKNLRDVWTEWLSTIKSKSVNSLLVQRKDFMVQCHSRLNNLVQHGVLDQQETMMSFAEAVDRAVKEVEEPKPFGRTRRPMGSDPNYPGGSPIIRQEIRQYFLTGNSSWDGQLAKASVNPTLLQPVTGKWATQSSLSPFEGYFPMPLKELLESKTARSGGILFSHCWNELKKILVAFRKRMDGVKFVFHPCDALAFCFEDSTDGFDVIDTSNLVDYVGLANLLNAASRKLRSDRSALYTESMFVWSAMSSDVAHYVQEVLCCPLSLIPTLYGLRLMDRIELGAESVPRDSPFGNTSSRIRWKKALPFDGVTLVISPALEQSLDRLLGACCPPQSGDFLEENLACGVVLYSPLTLRYVLNDLVRRGGSPDLMDRFLSAVQPIFRKALEASQAWMEQRPVWRVTSTIHFDPLEQMLYDRSESTLIASPILRLVLIPAAIFSFGGVLPSAILRELIRDTNSTRSHLIDNFELDVKMKPGDGGIDKVSISFLLEDLSLMRTHVGMLLDMMMIGSPPIFLFGLLYGRPFQAERFERPYPWPRKKKTLVVPSVGSLPQDPQKVLIGQDCQESEGSYSIRLKVRDGSDPLALKLTTDYDEVKMWPCQSAHRIYLSLDGVDPLTITLPHPFLPDTINATLRRKDRTVEIAVDKALDDLWPDDVLHQQGSLWNAEDLKPWTDKDSLSHHVCSQFTLEYLKDINTDARCCCREDVLTRVREIIRTLFVHSVRNEGDQYYSLRVEGSTTDKNPDWLIRTHPPVRISPRGTPILIVSALDCRLVGDAGKDSFRLFRPPKEQLIVPIRSLNPEDIQLFRYVLRLDSVKMRPTSWQKANLSGRPCWLATFVRPLYRDSRLNVHQELSSRSLLFTSTPLLADGPCCGACGKTAGPLKRCARCTTVLYCSVGCQRADWKRHKLTCFQV